MPPVIRLIAIDIDGTLLGSDGALPPRNRRVVRRAIEQGVEIALVTGRAFHHARPVAEALAPGITLIVSNGALTKRTDGETLACRLLPREVARPMVVEMRHRRHGVAAIFDRRDERQYVYDGIDWSHPQRRWYFDRYRDVITRVTPLDTALTEDPVQVAATGGVEAMRALAADLRGLPLARQAELTLTEYADRDFALLDVMAAGWSKGMALAGWTRHRGLRPADVMAVGDNLNDREMLEFAGRPVVMGNAVEALHGRGWPVTGTHDDCGLAQAIERVLG